MKARRTGRPRLHSDDYDDDEDDIVPSPWRSGYYRKDRGQGNDDK